MAQKFTADEINCKVKNFTKKYREEKTKIGPSGDSPSPWKHYNAVHRIVGCTAVNSALRLSENSTLTQLLPPFDPSLSPPSPSPSCPLSPSLPSPSPACPMPSPSPSPATRKRNLSAELLKVLNKQTDILERVADETKHVSEEIIQTVRQHSNLSGRFLTLMEKIAEKL
ncbi:PREDICTED: myb-related transcription factor, partner of profilin-like [Bactrocera latifrons]|uniref:myb-related transcription factor, partner of profilin-like n=1 Tax=Bactrocera latifrons TaxID=174628 RepID=UPI0008DEA4E2|nr:PREDICTED: myb-related transcription factor, partner of profilin-like [Bactrocera latifrons]